MTDKSVHDATEEWVRHSITKEFAPIDINDVYKAFAAGAQWQSQQAQGEPVAWAYEYHEFGDIWARHVILNRVDGGANPPTKHHGSPVRNVTPLYTTSPPAPAAVPEGFRRHLASVIGAVISTCAPKRGEENQYIGGQALEELTRIEKKVGAMLTASPAPEHIADVRKMVAPDVSELEKAAQKLWRESYNCESDFIQAVVDAFSKQEEE